MKPEVTRPFATMNNKLRAKGRGTEGQKETHDVVETLSLNSGFQ